MNLEFISNEFDQEFHYNCDECSNNKHCDRRYVYSLDDPLERIEHYFCSRFIKKDDLSIDPTVKYGRYDNLKIEYSYNCGVCINGPVCKDPHLYSNFRDDNRYICIICHGYSEKEKK